MPKTSKQKDLTVDEIRVAITKLTLPDKIALFKSQKAELETIEQNHHDALQLLSEVNGDKK